MLFVTVSSTEITNGMTVFVPFFLLLFYFLFVLALFFFSSSVYTLSLSSSIRLLFPHLFLLLPFFSAFPFPFFLPSSLPSLTLLLSFFLFPFFLFFLLVYLLLFLSFLLLLLPRFLYSAFTLPASSFPLSLSHFWYVV